MAGNLVVHSPGSGVLQPVPGEMVFLHDGSAFVSNLRCVFVGDARIYASSGITSVGIISTPQKWLGAVFWGFVGGISALTHTDGGFLVAAVSVLLVIFLWRNGRPKHYLSLHTAGVNYTPLWSWDRNYIAGVIAAVNNAIVFRG